jgi:long-subunit acyl-CoA synthetase (AMP-forming)/alkylation response protein AidB-like acyl-CoA dehydrogenase
LVALMRARLDASHDRPAVCDALDQGRTWTWGELIAAAVDLADRFDTLGLRRGQRLAHLGSHSPDWIVVDLACQLAGVVHVPLHADATAAEHAAQLAWLAPQGIVWSGCCRRGSVGVDIPIEIDLRTGHRSLHHRLSHGGGNAGMGDAGVLKSGCWKRRHADRAALRDDVSRCVAACDPDACSTILLSSGTTGRPKGVLHSQRAVVANAVAATRVFLDEPDDVRLSWLPLSHSLARTGDLVTALVRGGCLNVVTDRRRVLDACRVLPPTVVLGVPAFFERLERGTESGRIPDLPAALGGRVRVCVSGGAALRERTAVAFSSRGLPLVQGYGLAEAGPVVALANPRIARLGTVGPPLEGVELKLDTRPATLGQLLVRTPGRALGVIGDDPAGHASPILPQRPDEQPAHAGRIDPEWLETGDLAAIDADGHVRITGRVVDTLVLSGGTKVPPAEVEAAVAEDPVVAQVCVVGNGLTAPVALVVPEPAVLRAALRRMGVRVLSRQAALRHPRVVRWLGRRLARRQRHLPRGFRVRRAVLIGRAFDAAHGEATESLKLRRTAIAAHFARELAAAAEPVPPSWIAVVSAGPPCGLQHADATGGTGERDMTTRSSWAASSVWGGSQVDATAPSGFAMAAAQAAEPPRAAIADVVERAGRVIAEFRDQSRLYDEANLELASAWSSAPLDDAPAVPVGKFSQAAETALGATGLWGLLVPERFGGTGCTMQELARVVTRFAADVPTAAGMLSVHSSIGAVSAVAAFGSESQQARHLPGLAQGRPLSIFGATEPDAGCDLHAIRSRLERHDDRLLLSGTKMFITGATYGRLVKLLVLLDGRPTVLLVRLPDADTPSFRLRHYRLHPLKHAHNAAIEFTRHEVDEADILQPPGATVSDAMRIVWHGLNRGRITLAAQASGTQRLLLRQAREHALRRRTWGEPIASRELVQGRLARIAAGIVACDSLASWAAASIDAGQSGELEAITAKIVAGECVREGAINSLGVHGGRAFLVGHPLGDSFHDHFAVTVYEGESDLLGLALFKGLAKHHPLARLARESSAGRRAAAWLAWRIGRIGQRPHHDDSDILDRRLRDHAAAARRLLDRAAIRIDRGIRRQGKALADRQLLVGSWSAEVRDLVSVLAVAHYADAAGDHDVDLQAADCWCRLALARGHGRRLTASDHAALASLGRMVVEGPA